MPRPKKPRFVSGHPAITAFVPQGVPVSGEVSLSVEELESIRLSDFERLDQESAANLMKVSRQTYGRILANARGVVGEALVMGKALRVEGGTYQMRGRGQHRRRGIVNKISAIDEKEVYIMARDDGRWPQGQGSRPGKGRGRCNPNNGQQTPNERGRMGSGRGTGQGQGQGSGRGQGQGQGQGQGSGRGSGKGGGRRR